MRDAAFHARRAERVTRTLGDLGPVFVKLAQLLATLPLDPGLLEKINSY